MLGPARGVARARVRKRASHPLRSNCDLRRRGDPQLRGPRQAHVPRGRPGFDGVRLRPLVVRRTSANTPTPSWPASEQAPCPATGRGLKRSRRLPTLDRKRKTELTDSKPITSEPVAGPAGDLHDQACRGLFCFIGAEPATGWLTGVALDEHGFVRTDVQLTGDELGETWAALGRGPLPFETSVPGVFAVGDVRRGSMKRVAAAVGEGASAVRSVHTAIGVRA
jgi:hypothetical protein